MAAAPAATPVAAERQSAIAASEHGVRGVRCQGRTGSRPARCACAAATLRSSSVRSTDIALRSVPAPGDAAATALAPHRAAAHIRPRCTRPPRTPTHRCSASANGARRGGLWRPLCTPRLCALGRSACVTDVDRRQRRLLDERRRWVKRRVRECSGGGGGGGPCGRGRTRQRCARRRRRAAARLAGACARHASLPPACLPIADVA